MVQLSAMNTPQFSWVKTRLPRKPQPVPPIYQPEVAARAIVHAATHYQPELWLGIPAYQPIIGNRLFPGFLDHHLARNGYESQQYDGRVDPERKNNLWEPVHGDHGAHGDFDQRARNFNPLFWIVSHLRGLATVTTGLVALALTIFIKKQKQRFS